MAAADSCSPQTALQRSVAQRAAEQVSSGKSPVFRSIYPSHLRPPVPGDIGLRVISPPRPTGGRLLCASCSSGQSFAYSFLPTPPRGDAVAVQLTVPVTKARRDLSSPRPRDMPSARYKEPRSQERAGPRSLESPRGAHGLSQGLCTERSQTVTLRSVRFRVYFSSSILFVSLTSPATS
jgi:hypothetical protein